MHFGPERRVHDVSATATAAGGVPGRRWGRVDPVSGRHRALMKQPWTQRLVVTVANPVHPFGGFF